ncbi:MAG: hypothetical protein ACO1OB_06680 [Archangium sp.]
MLNSTCVEASLTNVGSFEAVVALLGGKNPRARCSSQRAHPTPRTASD